MEQFLRSELLFGKENMKKLFKAKVAVIGLGAVGSFAVEILARLGVGRLKLVDFDKIHVTNINRQLYALHSTIGKSKTQTARERIADINPQCKIETFDLFANTDTFEKIFEDKPDAVIDAIDSYNPKLRLIEYCYKNKIKIVSSMGAALKTDPLSVKYADLFDTHHCKLAERLRGDLRKAGITKGIPCIFSEQPPQIKAIPLPADENVSYGKNGGPKILGSSPAVTGIFGILTAHKAAELIIQTH